MGDSVQLRLVDVSGLQLDGEQVVALGERVDADADPVADGPANREAPAIDGRAEILEHHPRAGGAVVR